MKIYRIKSLLHFFQVMQLVDFDKDNNWLIVNHSSLKYIIQKSEIRKIFAHIEYKPYEKGVVSNFYLLLVKFFKRRNKHEVDLLVTPEHEIDHHTYKYFISAKEIQILSDGNMTYVDSLNKHSYYLKSSGKKAAIKKIFGLYGLLNYNDVRITKFHILDKQKMLNTKYLSRLRNYYVGINIYENRIFQNTQRLFEIYNKIFYYDYKNIDAKNAVIIITQPLLEDNVLSKNQHQKLIDLFIKECKGYKKIYLKLHPREKNDNKYQSIPNLILIPNTIPFEMFKINGINFSKGITYNSTAINYDIFNQKVIISEIYDL